MGALISSLGSWVPQTDLQGVIQPQLDTLTTPFKEICISVIYHIGPEHFCKVNKSWLNKKKINHRRYRRNCEACVSIKNINKYVHKTRRFRGWLYFKASLEQQVVCSQRQEWPQFCLFFFFFLHVYFRGVYSQLPARRTAECEWDVCGSNQPATRREKLVHTLRRCERWLHLFGGCMC